MITLDSKVYAIDFDGTLCENAYPLIGEPVQSVIDYVKALKADGHRLILWTCRTDDLLEEAVNWCTDQGISFDAVNENLQDNIDEYETDPRKVFADYYIDDRAITVESITEMQHAPKKYMQALRGGEQVKKYYSLVTENNEASIMIYGDITSWPWIESDVSSFTLSKEIEGLDVETINVFINSYGGEVAEALAICSALQRHKAKIKTYCDGFACSAAADVFMAGDERIMSNAALLMIHNAWCYACGNANDLRKTADDIEKITAATMKLFTGKVSISEEELKQLLDDETWLLPQEALDMGFATAIFGESNRAAASQSAKAAVINMVRQQYAAKKAQREQQEKKPPEQTEATETPPDESKPRTLVQFFSALTWSGKENK